MRPFTCEYKHTQHTHTHTHTHAHIQRMLDITKCKVCHLSPWSLCEVVQYIQHTPVSSTYITPVQYIQYISPVQHRHLSCTFIMHVRVKCRPITINSVWISLPTQLDLGFRISNTGIPKSKKFQSLNNNQLVVKWCLGLQLDTSRGTLCALCPDVVLDTLDHHAATCRHGVDVVVRHHKLRDVFLSYCHIAELEAGRCLTRGLDHTHLADVLVRDRAQGKPADVCDCACVYYIFVCSFVSPTQVGLSIVFGLVG